MKIHNLIPGEADTIRTTISQEAAAVKPLKPTLEADTSLWHLQQYWLCKADECERVENFWSPDRATRQQAKSAKEVYRTCVRELQRSLEAGSLAELIREHNTLSQLAANAAWKIGMLELERRELRQALTSLLKTPWTIQNEQAMRRAMVALGLPPHAPKTL